MAYTFDQIFAADPANPANVAQNAMVTIFAPGDSAMTPLTITTPDGAPLANPVAVNANGFGSAFAHATLDRVAWAGGGFSGFFTSYEGMKSAAVAAQAAAETAGANAAAVATAAIGDATTAANQAASSAAASATAAANAAALVGAPSDNAVKALVDNTASVTSQALAAQYNKKGDIVYNARDYGVKGDGTTDDTAALNTAATAAQGQRLLIPAGTYKTTGTLILKGSVNAWDAQINYTGTGIAVQVGSTADLLMGKELTLPYVNHVGSGWDVGSVGIDLVNLYSCNVSFQRVKGFETGIQSRGVGGRGMVYNTITVGYLDNNRVNSLLTHDETGWINENTYIGGRYSHIETGSYGVAGDANTHHIKLKRGSTTIGGPNNNVFLKPSLEGNPVDQYRVVLDGARYNAFINARWETAGAYPAKVKYSGASDFNRLEGGYDLWKVVEEFDAGTVGGTIRDGAGALVLLRSATAQTLTSGATATFTGWNPGASALRRCTYSAGVFTPRPGDWNIHVQLGIDSNATGIRRAWLKTTDGTTIGIAECGPTGSARAILRLEGRASFTGANGFYVEIYQNSGVDLATNATTGYCTVNAHLSPV